MHPFLSSWNESNFSLTSRKMPKKTFELFRKFLDCHDQIWSEHCNLFYQSMYHLSAIIRNQWWWFSEHSKSEYKCSVVTKSSGCFDQDQVLQHALWPSWNAIESSRETRDLRSFDQISDLMVGRRTVIRTTFHTNNFGQNLNKDGPYKKWFKNRKV